MFWIQPFWLARIFLEVAWGKVQAVINLSLWEEVVLPALKGVGGAPLSQEAILGPHSIGHISLSLQSSLFRESC